MRLIVPRVIIGLALVTTALFVTGCAGSGAYLREFTKLYAETQGIEPPPTAVGRLLLFGGSGHGTYLGCLNCSSYESDSILNQMGKYGSSFNGESIFNRIGQFGSRISRYSACNAIASDPPVIVDDSGRFYGRLTLNRYHSQASRDAPLFEWLTEACQSSD